MLLSIGMLMLSATQIYTIVTVQLFAFLNLLPVEADILAVSIIIFFCMDEISIKLNNLFSYSINEPVDAINTLAGCLEWKCLDSLLH